MRMRQFNYFINETEDNTPFVKKDGVSEN